MMRRLLPLRHLLLILVALVVAPDASAQYKWRDENGRLVYSDQPPPTSIPQDAVLQAPGLRPSAERSPGTTGDGAKTSGAGTGSAGVTSAADRELEFRKRRMERTESERKAAEETAKIRQAATACEETRAALRTLESGMRLSRVNESGEREVLDDAQRAARIEAARKTSRELCTKS
ncbi:MAG: DUF4124 domain-containing protein [Burkholderiales bacterium]|jgi:hypothetical protein